MRSKYRVVPELDADTRDVSREWRLARVDEYSPAFQQWVQGIARVTVRPGESLHAIALTFHLEG